VDGAPATIEISLPRCTPLPTVFLVSLFESPNKVLKDAGAKMDESTWTGNNSSQWTASGMVTIVLVSVCPYHTAICNGTWETILSLYIHLWSQTWPYVWIAIFS
jgi:hypothetical protein